MVRHHLLLFFLFASAIARFEYDSYEEDYSEEEKEIVQQIRKLSENRYGNYRSGSKKV